MFLIGDSDVATSILVIPCDKQSPYQIDIKPIPHGKQPIYFGNFVTQYVFAKKCICGKTPCKGIVTNDWFDVRYSSLIPMGNNYDEHKQNVEMAGQLVARACGDVNIVLQAIQNKLNAI